MSRAKTQRKRARRVAPSAELKLGAARPVGPTRLTGRERRDAITESPVVPADPVARVIKTRN